MKFSSWSWPHESVHSYTHSSCSAFWIITSYWMSAASQVVLGVNNPPANAGDIRDADLIPGSGRSPGGGHGNPLQYSCLENLTDRGASWTTIDWVSQSWRHLKGLSTQALTGHQAPNSSVAIRNILEAERSEEMLENKAF